MSTLEALSLFFVMLALAMIPSSSVVLVVTRSISHGVRNGFATTFGIILGDLLFILLAILGLSVIAEKLGWLFIAIKYVGGMYLIWLGYSLLKSKTASQSPVDDPQNSTASMLSSFLAGLFLTLGDVKAILFYVSLFPTFIDIESLQLFDLLFIVLLTIATVGGAKLFYVFSSRRVIGITNGTGFDRIFKQLAGGMMVTVGAYLIVKT